jgi:hypothetical protein
LERQCKFSFGELVIYGIPPNQREHKLDIRHNLGLHMGMTDNSIDSFRIYDPYTHKVYSRNNVHRIQIDKEQILKHMIYTKFPIISYVMLLNLCFLTRIYVF